MAEEKLTEEAKLAQEAAPEAPAEKPEFPKEAIDQITSLRDDRSTAREGRRAAELNAARLQGENAALKAASVKTEKSPMEKAAAAQECSIDDVQVTGKLYREQQAFEQSHATAQSEQEVYDRQQVEYEAGLMTFPERDELIAVGGHLLTTGDKRNIWEAGKNSGKELKRILNFRIEQIQPKEKTEEPTKGKSKAEEEAEKDAKEKEEVPTQDEILSDKALDAKFKALTFAK